MGTATLPGTGPNLILKSQMKILFPEAPEITFFQWSSFAFPQSLSLLLIIWGFLCLVYVRHPEKLKFDLEDFRTQYKLITINFLFFFKLISLFFYFSQLGKIKFAEVVVLLDLIFMALLWLSRAGFGDETPGWDILFNKYPGDGTVAILASLILFITPACHPSFDPSQRILDWNSLKEMPWGIVILLGSGFSLAKGFTTSGLSEWVGEGLVALRHLPPYFMVFCIVFLINWITEITSNVAITNISLPVLFFSHFFSSIIYFSFLIRF